MLVLCIALSIFAALLLVALKYERNEKTYYKKTSIKLAGRAMSLGPMPAERMLERMYTTGKYINI